MILTEKVKFKINGIKIEYYRGLGYNIPKGNSEVEINIKDLSESSHVLVECKCDICNKITKIGYVIYLKNIKNGGYYGCGECRNIKTKKTNKERYGNENFYNKEKYKETCLEKYGTDFYAKTKDFLEKSKKTRLDRYGNENYNNMEKYKETCLRKYGVEHNTQNAEILLKVFKSGHKIKYFKETGIYYQGSFELDFLEKYYNSNIKRCESVKYKLNDKNKIYFPDFYYDTFNLIIEIKSKYTYNLHKERNIEKQKACENLGYKFLFIIDKDYSEFDRILKN